MNLVSLCIRIKINLPSGTAQYLSEARSPYLHVQQSFSDTKNVWVRLNTEDPSIPTEISRVIPRAMTNILVSFFKINMADN